MATIASASVINQTFQEFTFVVIDAFSTLMGVLLSMRSTNMT